MGGRSASDFCTMISADMFAAAGAARSVTPSDPPLCALAGGLPARMPVKTNGSPFTIPIVNRTLM